MVHSTEIHSWPVFTGWPGFGLLGYYGRRNGPYHFMNIRPATAKTTRQASSTTTTTLPTTTTTAAPITSTATKAKSLDDSTAFSPSTVAAKAVATTAPTVAEKKTSTFVSTTAQPSPLTRPPVKLFLDKAETKKPTATIVPVGASKDVTTSKKETPKK
ncbi:unnamed protein product [Bursaphelenchus xylophilus]|nr:unnamed protein product [Bursaphelenchus xylophilus]CAG9131975.1 unnamed protein product [Bursaphelenchus xylophilus]